MKKYTHVTIDRKKWSRGKQTANALLVTKDFISRLFGVEGPGLSHPKVGTLCCLGFACLALGAKKKDIAGIIMPSSVQSKAELPGLTNGYFEDSEFSKNAAAINDDPDITDAERESKLKKLARENKFIFRFI